MVKEIESNQSMLENLKPLETSEMEEEEEEVFDNRIFTALNNNPKQEIISVPGTPKELI